MHELELEFELDPQIKADTHALGNFPLSSLRLMNDAQYPWLMLVPRRKGVTEIYHLSSDDQIQLMRETSALAQAMSDLFPTTKMNVANLGNRVAQLHIHVIARHQSDPAWPDPVWGKLPTVPYTQEALEQVVNRLDALLTGEVSFLPE